MMFHLFVIHTQKLVNRQPRLHGVIQDIRVAVQARNMDFKCTMVLTPDPKERSNQPGHVWVARV
jgi:hypothetical protein